MTLNEALDRSAANFAGRVALVTQEEQLTFGEFRARVLKAASAFEQAGVKKGSCVAIALRNGPDFMIAYFGLCRIGAVAVPINFMVQKAQELHYMLNDCSVVGVVTQREFQRGFVEAKKTLPALARIWLADGKGEDRFGAFVDNGSGKPGAALVADEDVSAILYTSGTTGSPKGVMLSHANLTSNALAAIEVMDVNERDVMLTILPMFHTFAWTGCVLTALIGGIKNVISPSITPPTPWLKLMGRHGVSIFCAVPPVYSVLARSVTGLKGLALRYWFFRRVRFCVSGAAPLNPEIARAFEAAMGTTILEGYGLTETSPVATLNRPGKRRLGSVGQPIPGVQVRVIRDDETPAPAGEEGEVCIKGPNVMLGYFGQPDATRAAFTQDGWFKSGDVGVMDEEGYVSLRDRMKDMIINKGLKVFPAQVEQVIGAHPDVEEVAIVGIPDGTGDELIKAFIVLRKGAATDKAALMQFCRQKLDAYKRPRDIDIVDSLPKNALQKVLKRVLRQQELDKKKLV